VHPGDAYSVKDVLEMLAGGASEAQIVEDFPDLQAEDIRASLQYAAAQAITPCCKPREAHRRCPASPSLAAALRQAGCDAAAVREIGLARRQGPQPSGNTPWKMTRPS